MNEVKKVLKELKISQVSFSKTIGVSKQYMNDICNNRTQPSIKTLNNWAEILDIDVRRFLKTNKSELKDCIENQVE